MCFRSNTHTMGNTFNALCQSNDRKCEKNEESDSLSITISERHL